MSLADAEGPRARGGPQQIPRPAGSEPGANAPWADLPEDLRRPTVADVVSALAAAGAPKPSPVEQGGFDNVSLPESFRESMAGVTARPSAVLAPLYDHQGEAWVVLTRRSALLRSHSGEVSFPGGGHDPGDADLVATALREAEEETAMMPSSVQIIGELDHLSTITSRSFIVPYVGVLPERPELVPNEAEVDAILHVPLSELLMPEIFREERWVIGEFRRPIVFFDLFGDTVWGATGAMLRQLLGLVTGTLGRGELGHD